MDNISGHRILSESTCWIGKTQVAVKVRKIGHSDKIAVELLMFSPEVTYGPSDCDIKKVANRVAQPQGIASFDTSWLFDYSIDRKVSLPDASMVNIRIRKVVLAYHGVGSY